MADESLIDDAVHRLTMAAREAGADHHRFAEEAADHLACALEAERARGVSERDAQRSAVGRFGEPAVIGAALRKGDGMRIIEIVPCLGLVASIGLLVEHIVGDSAAPSVVLASLFTMAGAAALGVALSRRRAIALGLSLGAGMGAAAWVTSAACVAVVSPCPPNIASRFLLGTGWGVWVLAGVAVVISALLRLVSARGALGYGPLVTGTVALAVLGGERAWGDISRGSANIPILMIVGGWTWVAGATLVTPQRLAAGASSVGTAAYRVADALTRRAVAVSKGLEAN